MWCLYEEGLDNQTINEAVKAISEAQVLIIGGTSLAVYPAAGLIDYFRGEHLVVINKSPTPRDRYADLTDPGADRTGICTDSLLKPVKGTCSGYCQSYIRGVRDYGTSL